jgi:acetyl-CoA carboxylase biotin carboxyl carrier protein
MDLEKIEGLIKLMRSHGLHELKLKEGNDSIRLTQSAPLSSPASSSYSQTQTPTFHIPTTPAFAQEAPVLKTTEEKVSASRENLIEVRSPFVGTFYASPTPDADAFVTLNKPVRKGDPLCIVEAMKLMNEIEAERDGVIVEILIENAQPVEYNQVLFLMK